ncbi:MAG: hypothetical protein FWF88_09025 [Peptococcaceae bacterium]|nr:hypothetical protein [Peptococcaceae bacterium]
MHELTIRISRAFCRGVFPQLNGELEADTALASNSATSRVGERNSFYCSKKSAIRGYSWGICIQFNEARGRVWGAGESKRLSA